MNDCHEAAHSVGTAEAAIDAFLATGYLPEDTGWIVDQLVGSFPRATINAVCDVMGL